MAQIHTFSGVDESSWRILEGFEARLTCLETPSFEHISNVLDFRVSLLEANLHSNQPRYTLDPPFRGSVSQPDRLADLVDRITRLEAKKGVAYNFRERLRDSNTHIECPDQSCNEYFHREGDLHTHYEARHGPLFRVITAQNKCYPCARLFPSSTALTNHEKAIHHEGYRSRSELFLPIFHLRQTQISPSLADPHNRTTSFASLRAKEKILEPMIHGIHSGLGNLSTRSPGAVSLLLLFQFLGSGIPKVVLNRGCSPRKRWSDECEPREVTPVQAGLDPDLLLFLSDGKALHEAIQTLLSLSLLKSEKTGNGQEIFTFKQTFRISVLQRLSPLERNFWSIQATALFCHAFSRSRNLERL